MNITPLEREKMFQQHLDHDVQRALIRLCDALCQWERSTGRTSLLVLIEQDRERPMSRFEFVADCGKPIPDDSRHGLPPDEILRTHMEHYASS